MSKQSDIAQILLASLVIGGAIYFYNKWQKQTGNVSLLAEVQSRRPLVMEFTEEIPQIFPQEMLQEYPCNEYQYSSLTPPEVTRGTGLL